MYRPAGSGSRFTSFILFTIITIWAGGAWAQLQANNTAEQPFVTWLEGLGSQYQVSQGTAVSFSCSSTNLNPATNPFIKYLGSCFGNNSATPYIITAPPPPPSGTYGIPYYVPLGFSQTPLGNGTAAYDFYEIANNEAIVTVITLPPVAADYSFQSYMFERQNTSNYYPPPAGTQCAPGTGWPNPNSPAMLSYDCKYEQFGFFTNAVNNVDVSIPDLGNGEVPVQHKSTKLIGSCNCHYYNSKR